MKLCKKDRGAVTILVAGVMIFFILLFLVVGVNFVYVYYVRGELQNAADSAALAGAAKLDGTNLITQQNARQAAWKFACKNNAAHDPVFLITNTPSDCDTLTPPPAAALNGGNNADGDIVVGNWNLSLTPQFDSTRTPVNAVKVVARRTEGSPGGPVGLIFKNIIPGMTNMGVRRVAIAERPLRANGYIAMCQPLCPVGCIDPTDPTTFCTLDPPYVLDTGSTGPPDRMFAWSTLLKRVSSSTQLIDLICGEYPFQEVCGEKIWSSMGTNNAVERNLEAIMFDPNYDHDNKDIVGGIVTGWWLTVPVTTECPPGEQGQGSGNDPKDVWGYADVHIIAICATGGGSACRPGSAPASLCTPYPNHSIVIDAITCTSCPNRKQKIGRKPVLVQ